MNAEQLSAFAACGIELEYMIVDRNTLSVRPISDEVLRDDSGTVVNEISRGHLAWSNELTLHVVELKNRRPDSSLAPLLEGMQTEVRALNARLEPFGACLMPTAMHPWMDPLTETKLWPYQQAEIYQAYERIFGCHSHGFANLQSMHVNLPFANDAEFIRLHAAVRLVLPILPALAASSPIAQGKAGGHLDLRMENYLTHQMRVPATLGAVIPDSTAGMADYRGRVLEPMYAAIEPLDPEHVLRHEWLNARGAIACFRRNALEIRVIDIQECPHADLAIAAAICATVKALYESGGRQHQELTTERLSAVFLHCIRDGESAIIDDADYLAALGYHAARATAGELWHFLIDRDLAPQAGYAEYWQSPLAIILEHGTLARRILKRLGARFTREALAATYRELCECLEQGNPFVP